VHGLLGLSRSTLQRLMAGGVVEIEREVSAHGAACAGACDEDGCTAAEWLQYVAHEVASEKELPRGITRDERNGGKTLAGFAKCPLAVAAGLSMAHVLALRLYTTSLFRHIDAPLRRGCSAHTPHPLPATAAFVLTALEQLSRSALKVTRLAAASNGLQRAGWRGATATASAAADGARVRVLPRGCQEMPHGGRGGHVYRTMRDIDVGDELRERGGSELAIGCASSDRAATIHDGALDGESSLVLLKYRVDDLASTPPDLTWCSVLPRQTAVYSTIHEYAFPPGTHLQPVAAVGQPFDVEKVVGPSGAPLTVTIVEVVPSLPAACCTPSVVTPSDDNFFAV
jgi:hypothetical protein